MVGQPVAVSYTVTSTSGTPTGNVTVSDGTDSCTASVAAGTCNVTFTSAGAKSLTATYAGDTSYNGSASTPSTSHTVNKANTTTTITSDTPDPVGGRSARDGQLYRDGDDCSGTPTGNVTVSDGTQSCTGTVAAGTCSITFTTPGAKSLTATYAGDTNFNGSASTPATAHQVNKADTTTTITSDTPDPSVVGQAVTVNYSVTVNAPGSGTPTANVTVAPGGHLHGDSRGRDVHHHVHERGGEIADGDLWGRHELQQQHVNAGHPAPGQQGGHDDDDYERYARSLGRRPTGGRGL